jgi:hypothetical protein
MRAKVWKNPNKQDVRSGHAAWDAAVQSLMPGNTIDDGYVGNYIRPRQTPFYPDGRTAAAPGAMRNFDLGIFRGMPAEVRSFTESVTETEYAILYCLFHYDGERRIVHGWLVTRGAGDDEATGYRLLRKFYTGPTAKSRLVVDTAAEYLSN